MGEGEIEACMQQHSSNYELVYGPVKLKNVLYIDMNSTN